MPLLYNGPAACTVLFQACQASGAAKAAWQRMQGAEKAPLTPLSSVEEACNAMFCCAIVMELWWSLFRHPDLLAASAAQERSQSAHLGRA